MTTPNPTGASNIFLLASDGSANLLPTLRTNPTLASTQDSSGYSILHALASYNHLSLLREVSTEFAIPANLTDEDGETALFVVETVAAAQCLVQEVGVDWRIKNSEGLTAEERIRGDGEFTAVADYLGEVRKEDGGDTAAAVENGGGNDTGPLRLPPGVDVQVGTMESQEQAEVEAAEPDPEFKRRIEELAARDDFKSEEGQAELRRLVEDAVRGVGDRDVRRRVE